MFAVKVTITASARQDRTDVVTCCQRRSWRDWWFPRAREASKLVGWQCLYKILISRRGSRGLNIMTSLYVYLRISDVSKLNNFFVLRPCWQPYLSQYISYMYFLPHSVDDLPLKIYKVWKLI